MINDSIKQTINQGFFDQFTIWGLFMRMFRPCMYFVSLFFLLPACQINNTLFSSIAPVPTPIALPAPAENPVSYAEEIRPILEKKCVTCHSCYDAPCQLNLEGAEGLLRGAFRESIYGGARTEAMQPTRLGFDEQTISGWRERGFYSVLHAENKQSEALISEIGRAHV